MSRMIDHILRVRVAQRITTIDKIDQRGFLNGKLPCNPVVCHESLPLYQGRWSRLHMLTWLT